MFDYKHQIELKTKQKFSLFGEDYFGDKRSFWEYHQSMLNDMYDNIIKVGFPLTITDLELNQSESIEDLQSFHAWLRANQPFDFERLKGK